MEFFCVVRWIVSIGSLTVTRDVLWQVESIKTSWRNLRGQRWDLWIITDIEIWATN